MLTLVFGIPVSKGKVNMSLDLCQIAKKTTGDCEHGFVFEHVYTSCVWFKIGVTSLNHNHTELISFHYMNTGLVR